MAKTQPKGWPKHYSSKEDAQKHLKMMKTFGSYKLIASTLPIIEGLAERKKYDILRDVLGVIIS